MNNARTVLVTGASSGIGYTTAAHFQKAGWRVFGLSRSGRAPDGVEVLRADVGQAQEVAQAITQLLEAVPNLDAVIHAAGIGGAGSLEDFPLAEAEKIMQTNWFGTLHLLKYSLPHLRQQNNARFVVISSIAGLTGVPFHGVYSASKFAVEALVESVRMELSGSTVKVVSVCPGDTATSIISHQHRAQVEDVQAVYRTNYERAERAMRESVDKGIPPEQVAELVWQAVHHPNPNVRYLAGGFLQRLAPFAKRLLGSRLFEWAMKKYYGLS